MPAVPVGSSSRRPPLKELNVLAAPEAPAKKSYSFFCNTDSFYNKVSCYKRSNFITVLNMYVSMSLNNFTYNFVQTYTFIFCLFIYDTLQVLKFVYPTFRALPLWMLLFLKILPNWETAYCW